MKTEDSLKAAMDRRLSFLDDTPSCRAAVKYRIAREEEPVVKKKISVAFVFAMALVLLSVTAMAAGLLLSARVSAARLADQALESKYGITPQMQTFFAREEQEQADGTVYITYTGVGSLEAALGTYTAVVRDGHAEVSWSHDGADTTGGYGADAWGLSQLKQMMDDSLNEEDKLIYTNRAQEIADRHGSKADTASSPAVENYLEQREAEKTAALKARKLSEEDMIGIGREFIISSYNLNEEQISRLELYTNRGPTMELLALIGITEVPEQDPNEWYETIKGVPCFEVEYLLYSEGGDENRTEKDGYYIVYVNVETGAVEQFEYNSALGGWG